MNQNTEKLRAMIAPEPQYPAPWSTGKNPWIVVCANGRRTAECPTDEAAAIIVAAVNEFAARAADPHKVELALSAAFWGSTCTGNAQEIARKALAALAVAGYTVIDSDAVASS